MTDRKSGQALLWFVLASGVLSTLFFFTSSLDPFNFPKSVVILGGGFAVLFGLMSSARNVDRSRWEASILVLLLITFYVIAAIVGTDNPRRLFFGSFSRSNGLVSTLGMALLALGAIAATRGQRLTGLYSALSVVCGFEVLYGFLQFLNADPVKWNNPYNRIIGSLGNPNFMSAALGFSGVAMVALLFDPTRKIWIRISASILGISAFLLAIATESVQGPIAFLGGTALVIGIALWQKKGRSALFYIYSTVAGLSILTVALGVAKIGPLADRLYQYTLGVRTQYWRAAMKMMIENPIFGVGVDSYGDHYRLVRDTNTFKTVGPTVFTNAAHSVPLQLGATLGIPVLVIYVLLQLFVAYRVIKTLKSFPNQRSATAGIAGAWLAFQAQSLISIDQLGVGVWGWILAGSLIGGSYVVESKEMPRRVRRKDVKKSTVGIVASMAAFGLILGFLLGWQGYKPDLQLRNAMAVAWNAQDKQSVSVRTSALVDAINAIPGDVNYQSIGILELVKMTGVSKDNLRIAEDVARQHPESWDMQNLVAELLEHVNMNNEAIKYRKAQIKLDPANWIPKLTLANDLIAIEKPEEAKVYLNQVKRIAPNSPEAETATSILFSIK